MAANRTPSPTSCARSSPADAPPGLLVDAVVLTPVPAAALAGVDVTIAVNLLGRQALPAWLGEPGFDLGHAGPQCRVASCVRHVRQHLRAARGPARDDASGFTVTTVPLTALGRREDDSPRYRLVLARRASTP
jgi:hypothetical protein